MRLRRVIVLLVIFAAGVYYLMENSHVVEDHSTDHSHNVSEQKDTKLESKEVPEERSEVPLDGDSYQWMHKTVNQLQDHFGEPVRKDLSAYGYEWWVYTEDREQYLQFGIENNRVTQIYALGEDLAIEPVQIGQAYEAVADVLSFSNEVSYSKGPSSYTFHLRDEELQERPLVKVTDDVFLQLYFDTFTNKLSAIRLLSADILLQHQPYEVQYRGELPEKPVFTDDQWTEIEAGAEQQIFHLTNVIRKQHGKSALEWDEAVSEVAYLHSEDMAENKYFSHYGQNGDGLKERLAAKEVFYQAAGENIAAQYPDAQSALHGWMNSEGHREALLNDDFTHLGVGVYQFYYTQNFLKKQ
ncbi:CAP domain-containing protein [Lentibacillus salinarum]|uniref:CAP domain-containing protein n=1 Tax=Lentibacillus salinarum TaxID=446820 RepID=A0ABW3ZPD3_9BACI